MQIYIETCMDSVCGWVDMTYIDTPLEALEYLGADHGLAKNLLDRDILVVDAEDLCRPFMGSHGSFDWEAFVDCRDHEAEESAKIAFVEWRGYWSVCDFEDCYRGEWDSQEAYAEELIDSCGYLDGVPTLIRDYFDYEKFTRDLFMTDCHWQDGHVFDNI